MMGSETFIMVAFMWREKRMFCSLAATTCSERKERRAFLDMKVPSKISPARRGMDSLRTVTVPSAATCSMRASVSDVEGDGLFVMGEVVGAHGGDVGLGVGSPLAHAVGVGFGELFDGLGGAAVGVAFAEDGVDGGSHHFGVAGLGFFFGVGGGFVYEVGDGVALGLELGDAGFELGLGSGDVGKLDDVGFGGLGEGSEVGEFVGDALLFGEAVGELGEDAGGEGDVTEFDVDAGRLGEALDDGEERVGGEGGGFVGLGVDDGGHDILGEGLRDEGGWGNAEVCMGKGIFWGRGGIFNRRGAEVGEER